uniref:SH3 domain-containing protein n=1 Tax=Chromera velia CCMP2878 TaxID=1169474 RepID=A0A0G4HQ68_9ALVE|eukprot:Cvel_7889.t1-p1 / transcript=Cvel_7889.t1 / gene=Cvel_7889 / organism=Chromera_velia_CCMP2878 / gene_product=hypothetical protein / transcript_product=hypothetical protein / location=Cvel_scaffold423:11815-13996(+) / protein_length=418 / sequence_SO=supercontig / SO=protein_coding / is_pseudo=false
MPGPGYPPSYQAHSPLPEAMGRPPLQLPQQRGYDPFALQQVEQFRCMRNVSARPDQQGKYYCHWHIVSVPTHFRYSTDPAAENMELLLVSREHHQVQVNALRSKADLLKRQNEHLLARIREYGEAIQRHDPSEPAAPSPPTRTPAPPDPSHASGTAPPARRPQPGGAVPTQMSGRPHPGATAQPHSGLSPYYPEPQPRTRPDVDNKGEPSRAPWQQAGVSEPGSFPPHQQEPAPAAGGMGGSSWQQPTLPPGAVPSAAWQHPPPLHTQPPLELQQPPPYSESFGPRTEEVRPGPGRSIGGAQQTQAEVVAQQLPPPQAYQQPPAPAQVVAAPPVFQPPPPQGQEGGSAANLQKIKERHAPFESKELALEVGDIVDCQYGDGQTNGWCWGVLVRPVEGVGTGRVGKAGWFPCFCMASPQ